MRQGLGRGAALYNKQTRPVNSQVLSNSISPLTSQANSNMVDDNECGRRTGESEFGSQNYYSKHITENMRNEEIQARQGSIPSNHNQMQDPFHTLRFDDEIQGAPFKVEEESKEYAIKYQTIYSNPNPKRDLFGAQRSSSSSDGPSLNKGFNQCKRRNDNFIKDRSHSDDGSGSDVKIDFGDQPRLSRSKDRLRDINDSDWNYGYGYNSTKGQQEIVELKELKGSKSTKQSIGFWQDEQMRKNESQNFFGGMVSNGQQRELQTYLHQQHLENVFRQNPYEYSRKMREELQTQTRIMHQGLAKLTQPDRFTRPSESETSKTQSQTDGNLCYDALFEQADKLSRKKEQENKKGCLIDQDMKRIGESRGISIQMEHAWDDCEEEWKLKKRIGQNNWNEVMVSTDSLFQNLSSKESQIQHQNQIKTLNNFQSREYQNFLENQMDSLTERVRQDDQVSTKMKQFMDNYKEQAEERRNNKIERQIKRDDDRDNQGQALKSYKHLQERKQRKQREEEERLKQLEIQNSKFQAFHKSFYSSSLRDEPGNSFQREWEGEGRDIQSLLRNADTIHPNKLKEQQSQVQQNFIVTLCNSQGVTGSSLGFGEGNPRFQDLADSDRNQMFQIPVDKARVLAQVQSGNRHQVQSGIRNHQGYLATNTKIFSTDGPSAFLHNSSYIQYPLAEQLNQNSELVHQVKKSEHRDRSLFYESRSKYLSLRRISEKIFEYTSLEEIQSSKKKKKENNLEKSVYFKIIAKREEDILSLDILSWFEKLLHHERSVSLTIIDSDLVSLIRSMQQKYAESRHGFFSFKQSNKTDKLKHFDLYFRKADSDEQYTYSRQRLEQQQSEECLISNLVEIKVGDQDGITLTNHIFENTSFFLKIFRQISKRFLLSPLKIEKTEASKLNSLFKLETHPSKDMVQKMAKKKTKSTSQTGDTIFVMNVRESCSEEKTESNVAVTSADFRKRNSLYQNVGTKSVSGPGLDREEVIEKTEEVTLGQMLVHLFEKAINVQFHDFKGKLTNQMKDQMFDQTDSSLDFFQESWKLAKFWQKLDQKECDSFWGRVEGSIMPMVVEDIKKDEDFQKIQDFKEIKEESENDGDSDVCNKMKSKFGRDRSDSFQQDTSSENSNQQQMFMSKKTGYGLKHSDTDSNKGWGNQKEVKPCSATGLKQRKLFGGAKSESDSDDIEKQMKSVRQTEKLGVGPHQSQSYGANQVLQAIFSRSNKGYKALDNSETVTENSDMVNNDPTIVAQRQQQSVAEKERGEEEGSNYDQDEFEDMEDDFCGPISDEQHRMKSRVKQEEENIQKLKTYIENSQVGKQTVFSKTSQSQPIGKGTQKDKSREKLSPIEKKEKIVKETILSLVGEVKKKGGEARKQELGRGQEDIIGLNRCFMFIRSLTVFMTIDELHQFNQSLRRQELSPEFQGLLKESGCQIRRGGEQRGLSRVYLKHLIQVKLLGSVLTFMREECERKNINDLLDYSEEDQTKNKKKKKNKKKAEEGKQIEEVEEKKEKEDLKEREEREVSKGSEGRGMEEGEDKNLKKKGGKIRQKKNQKKKSNWDEEQCDEWWNETRSDLQERDMERCEQLKQELSELVSKDKELKEQETQMLLQKKLELGLQSSSLSASEEKLPRELSSDEHRKNKVMQKMFFGEYIGLLSGQMHIDKYPDELKDKVDFINGQMENDILSELEQDLSSNLTMFQVESALRKRTQQEINQETASVLIDHERKMRERNESLERLRQKKLKQTVLSDLDQMNSILEQIPGIPKNKEVEFVDLLKSKEKGKQVGDYAEKVKDEGEIVKKKKKKNKKKKQTETVEVGKLEESMKEVEDQVSRTLQMEKHSDQEMANYCEKETLDPKDEMLFDDDFYQKETVTLNDISCEIPDNQIQDRVTEIVPEEIEDEKKDNQEDKQQPVKRKMNKKEKKKEAKQKAKLVEQMRKQEVAEQREQKAQLKLEKKMQLEANHLNQTETEDDNKVQEILQTFITHKTQQSDQILLPPLSDLNQPTEEYRQSKKVQFKKDPNYSGVNVPKRGSSRGTSMASSQKQNDENILHELDEFFPKETIDPNTAIKQSIKESLSNSKRTSLESSTIKNVSIKEDKDLSQILNVKLEQLQSNIRSQDEKSTAKRTRSLSCSNKTESKMEESQFVQPNKPQEIKAEVTNQQSQKLQLTKKQMKKQQMAAKTTEEKQSLNQKKQKDQKPKEEEKINPYQIEIIRPEPAKQQSKGQKKKQKEDQQKTIGTGGTQQIGKKQKGQSEIQKKKKVVETKQKGLEVHEEDQIHKEIMPVQTQVSQSNQQMSGIVQNQPNQSPPSQNEEINQTKISIDIIRLTVQQNQVPVIESHLPIQQEVQESQSDPSLTQPLSSLVNQHFLQNPLIQQQNHQMMVEMYNTCSSQFNRQNPNMVQQIYHPQLAQIGQTQTGFGQQLNSQFQIQSQNSLNIPNLHQMHNYLANFQNFNLQQNFNCTNPQISQLMPQSHQIIHLQQSQTAPSLVNFNMQNYFQNFMNYMNYQQMHTQLNPFSPLIQPQMPQTSSIKPIDVQQVNHQVQSPNIEEEKLKQIWTNSSKSDHSVNSASNSILTHNDPSPQINLSQMIPHLNPNSINDPQNNHSSSEFGAHNTLTPQHQNSQVQQNGFPQLNQRVSHSMPHSTPTSEQKDQSCSKLQLSSNQFFPSQTSQYGNQVNQFKSSTPQTSHFAGISMQVSPQQHQINHKMQQLQSQGFVLNQNDQLTLQRLSLSELNLVHQFYEVLDTQILKLIFDQEKKLRKTQKLRETAFGIIRQSIMGFYEKRSISRKLTGKSQIETKIQIYGSMETGLAIDSSDLDILISNFVAKDSPRYQSLSRLELVSEMQILHQELNNVFGLKTNQLIESASVPVIKLQMNLVKIFERDTENLEGFTVDKIKQIKEEIFAEQESRILQIDITFDESRRSVIYPNQDSTINEHLGVQCCKYIKSQIEQYPQLKTLALVFKKFLALKNLNKPYSGGLSSYSLIQMILSILKMEQQFDLLNNLTIGMIFKHFIYEYGFKFNPNLAGIGQDAFFHDKREFVYMQHNVTCNINRWEENQKIFHEKAEQLKKQHNGIVPEGMLPNVDRYTCSCGYSEQLIWHKRAIERQQKIEANQKQASWVNVLQKLMLGTTNQINQTTFEDEEFEEDLRIDQLHQDQINEPFLVIVDPLNKFNNIGKSSYNFEVIQQEMRDIYSRLNEELVDFVRAASEKQQKLQGAKQSLSNGQKEYTIDELMARIFNIDYQSIRSSYEDEDPAIAELFQKIENKKLYLREEEERKARASQIDYQSTQKSYRGEEYNRQQHKTRGNHKRQYKLQQFEERKQGQQQVYQQKQPGGTSQQTAKTQTQGGGYNKVKKGRY